MSHADPTDRADPIATGPAGRLAAHFLLTPLTPLLALVALLLGLFAVWVTPREEEPQIDVTMAQVMIAFPGAAVREVENLVATPAEQVLSRMAGVEHVMSVSRPGLALVTVQFQVGVPRSEALVRLHDTVSSHADWLPAGLGVSPPLIRPKGIDDVPVLAWTLHATRDDQDAVDLERVARTLQAELKRVPGTRDVTLIGAPGRALVVEPDAARLAAAGLGLADLRRALQAAHAAAPAGDLLRDDRRIALQAGGFIETLDDLAELVVTVRDGRPVLLRELATLREGTPRPERRVWHGLGPAATAASASVAPVAAAGGVGVGAASAAATPRESLALTLAITKKPGANAIDVAEALAARLPALQRTLIPADVAVVVSRDYGRTADDKARQLIGKLLFATATVVALVWLALGRREAAIVGVAVGLTLTVTLFASWAWGFTLNRVSLFALIFSIGILVDDAIVVVENIHRHQALHPGRSLAQLIPAAVDEVGGPTILATLTVIAALLPMAFVSGLMGPYMAPIPINASLGMALSLLIAFVLTPWLARLWMKPHAADAAATGAAAHGPAAAAAPSGALSRWLAPAFRRLYAPLLARRPAARRALAAGVGLALVVSMALPALGWVQLKMLPFDNKSELQLVVDLPAGSTLERTAAVLQELAAWVAQQPEVRHYQAYAGTAAPITFNGLVRQYDLRSDPEQGDLQINLVDKAQRGRQSHALATAWRAPLQAIAARHGATLKVVEVPPGPPVLAPIVAEIYGPEAAGRDRLAAEVRAIFARTTGMVDLDDSRIAEAPRLLLQVERARAAQAGVAVADIVATLQAAQAGEAVAYAHDGSRRATPVLLQLPPAQQGELDTLLQLGVRGAAGALVPLRELVRVVDSRREQPVWHKDGLPLAMVVADMAGTVDSPLYGLFAARGEIARLQAPDGGAVAEHFISAPVDGLSGYALKWDGEWQITYETFRDMGAAYAVGLVLIYLLVVAQFGSYGVPLIIMAPIPLTLVGVMPGHALLGAQFTATSMIGMIALAGIIVRNSILLVDFIGLQRAAGVPLREAVVQSAITRAQPIVLTALAAMGGAVFILGDPIFNGLAISLIFGIAVSTVLTLVVIPLLYWLAMGGPSADAPDASHAPAPAVLAVTDNP
ncbi:efflux RND transporter permease subunit [Pseudaquabacterium rugosum]|uniref:Efflux RND transporter permease subunit n=1 Tax=Pseudaquabacterium rugosum TaxID=2984194 RepID=A0ABU9B9D2_9BURK